MRVLAISVLLSNGCIRTSKPLGEIRQKLHFTVNRPAVSALVCKHSLMVLSPFALRIISLHTNASLCLGASKPVAFHQAIFESEALDLGITSNGTRSSMSHVANETECYVDSLDSAATVQCLRDLPMEKLLAAQLQGFNTGDIWEPSVDGPGGFLPEPPSELLRKGKFARIASVFGWTENDGSLFVTPNATAAGTEDFLASYIPHVSSRNLQRLLDLYPVGEFSPSYTPDGSVAFTAEGNRLSRIYRDLALTCQPLHVAQTFHNAGMPVYTYHQNATLFTSVLAVKHKYGYGVIHTSELNFIFGNFTALRDLLDIKATPADVELRNRTSRSWTSFTALGHPSVDGKGTLQGWRLADLKDKNFGAYVIGGPSPGNSGRGGDTRARAAVGMQRLQERCALLNSPEFIKELRY